MNISICASLSFANDILKAKSKLVKLNHNVTIPHNTEKYADGTIGLENKWEKIPVDILKKYYEEIKQSDAILIINNDKKNVKNYIGGTGLIQIAFAHVLNKKIFLLNPVPDVDYAGEITAVNPVILNGDLSKIR